MDRQKIIIVGAGHGGVGAAMALRSKGFDGQITLLNDAPGLPCERPPLSKQWLTGDGGEHATLANDAMFASRDIDFRPASRVTAIHREARKISVESEGAGYDLAYDSLILATGAIGRRLTIAGVEAGHVYGLRSGSDARAIRAGLVQGGHLAIIGAGYIGLEVAASARKLGLEVTLIELASRCMARTASPEISQFYQTHHRNQGVRLIFDTGVTEIITRDNRAIGLTAGNGQRIDCDHVLIAAGALPDDTLAVKAGLHSDNGIIVDEDARTSDPAIFAIGDIARRPTPFADTPMRIESVHNAQEQARLATAAILGLARPKPEAPWFWSDQYNLKLQIAGLIRGDEERIVRHEAPDRFCVFHYRGHQIRAVEAVNLPVAYMVTRKALDSGKTIERTIAADPDADLRHAIR